MMFSIRSVAAVVFAAAVLTTTSTTAAFAPSPLSSKTTTTTAASSPSSSSSARFMGNTQSPPPMPAIKDISYGEESRKFRRTVYSHDDWRKHRNPDRFLYYASSIFSSGVYKNLVREVGVTTAIATFVVLANVLVGGYTDFNGVQHDALIHVGSLTKIGLPLAPFTLSSPSLGLLLVFRTNTSYQRWDEARKNWGMNINHTRDLVRKGNAMYDKSSVSAERRTEDLQMLALCTWAFVRAMKRHLSPEDEDEEMFQQELYEKLPTKEQADAIINAAHRPNRALQDLSTAIENLNMHFLRKNEIHKEVTIFEDNLGSSERLLTSPVPLFYSRHTARFLFAWLCLLPFALYDPFAGSWNHIAMIPSMTVISVFLFGIEELATQLEEPFTILPMQAFCDKIYNWCTEIVSWEEGDNGMTIKAPRPEHMAVAAAIGGATVATTATAAAAATAAPPAPPVVVEEPKEVVPKAVEAATSAPKPEPAVNGDDDNDEYDVPVSDQMKASSSTTPPVSSRKRNVFKKFFSS